MHWICRCQFFYKKEKKQQQKKTTKQKRIEPNNKSVRPECRVFTTGFNLHTLCALTSCINVYKFDGRLLEYRLNLPKFMLSLLKCTPFNVCIAMTFLRSPFLFGTFILRRNEKNKTHTHSSSNNCTKK